MSAASAPPLRLFRATGVPRSSVAEAAPSSFDEIYRRYAGYVAGLAGRIIGYNDEVSDVVQDVFLIVHRRLTSLRDAGAVRAWLARITVRRRIDAGVACRARVARLSVRAALVLAVCGVAGIVVASMAGRSRLHRVSSQLSSAAGPRVRAAASIVRASDPTESRVAHPLSAPASSAAAIRRPRAARDPIAALFERADHARLAGRPYEAVTPLRTILAPEGPLDREAHGRAEEARWRAKARTGNVDP